MLPLRPYRSLPLPAFDDGAARDLQRNGYRWAEDSVRGVSFRWLSAPDWTWVGALPEPKGDLTPATGFVHRPTGAVATLSYARPGFAFDPGDFLDVADPRPFASGNACPRDGGMTAERLGGHDGMVMAGAAHRFGRHLFVIASQGPAGDKRLMEALSVFNACLLVKAEPQEDPEAEREHRLAPQRLKLRCSARAEVRTGSGATVVASAYGKRASEVTLRVERDESPPAEVVLRERAALSSTCGLRPRTERRAILRGLAPALPAEVAVLNFETDGGSELALMAGRLPSGETLVTRALYPAATASPPAWLAARHALARLLRSLEPIAA